MSSKLITINETIYLSELESLLYDSASEYSVHGFPITKDEDKFEKEKMYWLCFKKALSQ